MKTIKVNNLKYTRSKRYIILTSILIFLSIIVIVNACRSTNNLKKLSLTEVDGIVTSFNLNDNIYEIEVSNENVIYLEANLETNTTIPTLKDNLKVNDKVYLKLDSKTKYIYIAKVNDNLLYNLIEINNLSNRNMIIFYGIILVVSIVCLIMNIISIIKTPKTKEMSQIEYILTANNVLSNSMLNDDSKTKHILKMNKILNYCLIAAMILVFVFGMMLKAAFDNNIIILCATLCLIAALIVLTVALKPKLYSTHLETFVNDYLFYLDNGNNIEKESTIFFKKEGFKVQDEEKVFFFDYHELNFYTVAVYSKSDAPVNLFICSALPEKEEFKDIQDFIIPFTYNIYKEIKENGVYIEGLEELINDLLSESKKNIKNIKEEPLVIFYKN